MALAAVVVALAVDHRLGEPPVRWHPVVWMGNYLEHAGAWLQTHAKPDPQARDLKVFEGNIKAEISSLDDEMSALAQKGGTNSDAYRERQAQLHSLVGEMVANPEFALGQKEAEIQLKRMESRHLGYGLIGRNP